MSIVAVVLVIACANLAGVLLARGVVRRREIAVRTAIGAGRGRVVRQLLTETTLLFALGGIAGLLLARVLTSLLVSLLPAFPLPVNVSVPLDGRVVAFSLVISFVAALLCGVAPALHASKSDVVSALKDDAPVPTDRLRLRNTFVVAQVAFSVLLVITAAILVRDVDRVTSVDRGFDSRQVDVASVNLSMAGYTAVTGSTFARQLIERVRAIPGVEAATLSDRQPDPGSMMMGGLTVPGVSPPQGQPYFYPNWNVVDSQYFATLRIPLLTGRDFTDADRAGAQPVAIIGEMAAKRFFPGKSAVGEVVHVHTGNLSTPGAPSSALVVVGVVRDMQFDPNLVPRLNLYVPLQQKYIPGITILARTTGPASVAEDIRGLVTSMNPNLPVLIAQSLDSLGRGPVEAQLRVAATVAGSVGFIGLLLAAIGIYGVTAYTVARRTREIGIRLSLGAGRAAVVGMILRQGMTLVGTGLALGLVLSVGVGRVLASQRFGITAPGVTTFVAATLLFVVVALLACYAPLRRAVRIGAMDALRCE
jgi:predicted permease